MKYLMLFSLCAAISSVLSTNNETRQLVINYLVEYGYLDSLEHAPYEFTRALRQFQRENDFRVNGRITSQIKNFIKKENDKQMVLTYLKSYGYIQGVVTLSKTEEAIKQLQRNSGILMVSGLIDDDTINFLKSQKNNNHYGYSEGLEAKK